MISHKACKDCGTVKSASEFYKNKAMRTGLASYCMLCAKVRSDARKRREVVVPDEHACSVCGVTKLSTCFSRNLRAKSGLYSYCKECAAAKHAAYAKANPHVIRKAIHKRKYSKRKADCRHWDPATFDRVYAEREVERQQLERDTGIPHHLDHVVPINGKNVCGLHVWYNWQILDGPSNMSKGNRFGDA